MRYHNFRSVKDFIGIGNRKIKSSSKNLSRNQQLIFNIDKEKCIGCGKCYVACRDGGYEAISFSQDRIVEVVKDKCVGCGLCATTCGRKVYGFDYEDNKSKVVNPNNCMVACQTCANLCPVGAISFTKEPQTTREKAQEIVKETKVFANVKTELENKKEQLKIDETETS